MIFRYKKRAEAWYRSTDGKDWFRMTGRPSDFIVDSTDCALAVRHTLKENDNGPERNPHPR